MKTNKDIVLKQEEFPVDWEIGKTLGDLFDFKSSLSNSREELGEEGIPYLHYGDMHKESFSIASYERYSKLPKLETSPSGKEKCLLKDGDVVFLDASEDLEGTSRCVLIDNPDNLPFFAGLHTIPAREKGDAFSKWYKQYLTCPNYIKKQFQRLASGFKVYGLNKDTIAQIKVVFPKDKKEQEKIAQILMKWDEAVELQEKYIEKLKQYKAICLQKMFPRKGETVPKWRFKRFTDPWEQRKANELCSITTGKSNTQDQVDDGKYPFYIRSDMPVKSNRYLYDEEAVITIGDGNIGKVFHYVNGKFDLHQRCYKMADFRDVLAKYFYYFFSTHFYDRAMKMTAKATVNSVRLEMISDMEILFPQSYDEQRLIAEYLTMLDNLIALHQHKLESIQEQRKAMQQLLLTGIVRVK